MNNDKLHDNFRIQLTNTHAFTVLTVTMLEIVAYILLVKSGIEEWSVRSIYLWCNVVLPIFINTICHLLARRMVHRVALSDDAKNLAIILATLVTSFVVSVFHKEYIATGCAFVFPMVLSAMFNDKKLLKISFSASILIWASVLTALWFDGAINITTILNLCVLFGFIIVAFLCARISINFSAQNYKTIEEQEEANEKLREDVLKDEMTDLFDHDAFFEKLEELVRTPNGTPKFCLAVLDVDDFKSVNDTYGHLHGDEVLISVADVLKKHCTELDIAGRIGGEEFAVVLQNKDLETARRIMQDALIMFHQQKYDFTDSSFTFSCGVVSYTPGVSGVQLLDQADQLMYQVKHTGKNRVSIGD